MHVPVGETLRTVCPFCGGGRTRERSFVATNDGTFVKYMCHRGSCGKRGKWDAVSGGPATSVKDKDPQPLPYVYSPTAEELSSYASKYSLTPEALSRLRPMRCKYSRGEERWWYPVFGPHGSEHGGIGRSFTTTPKSLTHIDSGYHLGSWYVKDGDATTVAVVEDQVSASKLAGHVTTVALLGCHLNDVLLEYLAKHTKHLLIALDFDALDKAVNLAGRVSSRFEKVTVVPLSKDVKDMSEEEIRGIHASN